MDWTLFGAVFGCLVLGFCAGVWWMSPPDLLEQVTALADPVPVAPVGLELQLFGKDTLLHSQQTRKAGTEHPRSIRKPHGNLAATTYDLVGIVNGIGVYREH